MKQILTESIRIDGDTQSRVAVDQDAVQEYADAMKAGRKFPPIVAFFDGTDYWVADGFHRVLAALRAGVKHLAAEITAGGRAEAAWASCGANLTHGIRRTNADKRKAVTLALKMQPDKSDSVLAEHCGVGRDFVLRTRHEVTPQPVVGIQVEKRVGADGKTRSLPPPPSQRPPVKDFGPPPASRRPAAWPSPASDGPPRRPPPAGKPVSGPVDDLGRRIPDNVLPIWERRQEVIDMLTAISRIRVAIREAQDSGDKLYSEVPYSATLAHLDQAYNGVQVAKPYAVCPFCQGHGCRACRERGAIGKHRWDTVVPEEIKKQVAALIAKEGKE